MPYGEWDEVNEAIRGIEPRVSLEQANVIAGWADAMEEAEDGPENPWAAAIARFKDLYEVEDGRWVKKSLGQDAEAGEFLFAEAYLQEGEPVEFLRVGVFTDAHGREVEVTREDLAALVANFEAGAAGQDVPIDVDHEKGEAAGWVTEVWRRGDRLLARVDWNSLGEELVGERVYRYLSATIDTARQVLKSISLVNFPAVKGLQPVELAEGGYTMKLEQSLVERIVSAVRGVFEQVEAGEEDAEEEVLDQQASNEEEEAMNEDELREQIREEVLAELEEEERTRAELREQVREEVEAAFLAERETVADLTEFAEGISLAAEPETVAELMARMDEEEREAWQEVLEAGYVDLSERGSSREGQGGAQELSAGMRKHLESWLEAGHDLEEFFEINAAELGEMSEYDLTEFEDRE
jgi:phage I-like protein